MENLLNAATDLAVLLSPSKIESIAGRIREATSSEEIRSLHQLVSTPAARSALERFLVTWKQTNLTGDVIVGILMGASHALQKTNHESTVELVWTGPTTPFVATRRTEQVLLDIIRGAQKELFLVSFVAYDVPSVVEAISSACSRNVKVRILLEAASTHGGSLTVNPALMMQKLTPEALLFAWTDRPHPFTDGRVHAKVAVADSGVAFLTSANLTGHALEKNMEAGVLIKGGKVPADLMAHLYALIETKVIHEI